MKDTIRNILAVLAGITLGGLTNGLILKFGMHFIPPPEGFDMNTPEGLNSAFAAMEFKHYVTPFLSHALGTFVGAFVAIVVASNRKKVFAYTISSVFFLGGLYMVLILNAPMWFNVTDLLLAYFPMAWLALRINKKA